ncbi:hypothetical protein [Aureibaculum luteum]|uniref:hypothetical protein n=1 Tax=Aureibaculum luteum TaxID=1548456 RepID=UPI000E532C28|nr:hypothetical protein [Aureibaculum luteum]
MSKSGYILIVALLVSFNAFSQPKRSSRRVIDNVIIYQDVTKKTHYYYVAYGLKLVKNKEGKPNFKFIQMRHTGTKVTENENSNSFKSLINFRVAINTPTKNTINAIISKLINAGVKIQELKPIAISNIDTELEYVTNKKTTDTLSENFKNGFFENTENSGADQNWKERYFTLRLETEDAQLFKESLENNRPTISLNYTFLAKFSGGDLDEVIASGSTELIKEFENENSENTIDVNVLSEAIVKNGSLSIDINTDKWPDLIKQVDLNERLPSEYAALDVYCYDFNNMIRDDLSAKIVEIKAKSVNGKEVVFKNVFYKEQPDIYAKTIKFIYAVKLSEPYEYRVTEIYNDGTLKREEWIEKKQWNGILDITSEIESN